jgi:hypothetical protein
MKRNRSYSKPVYCRIILLGTVAEIQAIIQGYYAALVSKYQTAHAAGDTASPFYNWACEKENIAVYISLGIEGLSFVLMPQFEQDIDLDELYYDLGGSEYLAAVESIGGRPAYAEFIKVVEYLLRPIRPQVGRVDYSEVAAYCRGGKGYLVLTYDEAPFHPRRAEMKAMGLATPDELLP